MSSRLVLPPESAPVASRRYVLVYPGTPGAPPSWQGAHSTLEEAEAAATLVARRRPDLHGQDVRIEVDGRLVERAGGAS